MCQNSPKSNNFQRKRAGEEKKWSKQKAQTSRDARPIRTLIIKSWVKGNVGSWDFTRSLVNYLHYVCAKIHPNRTNFKVKWQASKEVKTKGSSFTRCSTYSASNDKISGQNELKKMNLCMYLINYFHYVGASLHPNPTFLRVKRLARQKLVEPKSKSFTRCSTYSASNPKILSHGERRKLKVYILFSHIPPLLCAKFHPNRTLFRVEGLARRKVAEPKSTNVMRCSTYSASNRKISSQGNVGGWDSVCSLVNYLHYVSARFQPNRTTFRLKTASEQK